MRAFTLTQCPQCRHTLTDTPLLRAPLVLTCLIRPVLKLGAHEASLLWVWVSMLAPRGLGHRP